MGAHRRAVELLHALNRRRLAGDVDIGPHALQLRAVAEEPGLVHALRQPADPLRQGHAHADLGLHIRGEAGIGLGLHRSPAELAAAHHPHRVVVGDDLRSHFLELGGNALQMLGDHVGHQDVAPHRRGCRQVGPGLDLVGDDGVGAAVQGVDAPDLHRVGAGAGNPGAHGIEEVGKVHDVGLLGGVLYDRLTGQQRRRQHDVHRGSHTGNIQTDPVAPEAFLTGLQGHIVLRLVHIGSQGKEALDMLVDGPGSKITAAGQGHMGLSEPAQQRPHQVVAGPHLPHQVGVGLAAMDLGAVNFHHMLFRHLDPGAHPLQNIQEDTHIGYIRNIFDPALPAYQQGGGKNRYSRVLRAADGYGAVQRNSAANFISGQGISSPCDRLKGIVSHRFCYYTIK